ncbi:RNA polymerase sigma factor [Streptomyces bacillaris]|uniref:RNA polymerase subunit sigma n=2 Tax=Streptomyces TaxID=1883 RepID=A0A1E7LG89_9ACTN|nr:MULTISPECIES: sigma-70 family RNA polymerase sigma factor [Streptomyces]OEV15235.1 RNA polymerase subunit sigma [Streptomyces nanshensis]POG46805.1 RNA polymerase subunit sigma [Streptomyces sp. ZL-24]
MTLLDHEPDRSAVTARTVRALQPLVRAEARAEAPAAGLDPADLEQTVWLRLLERPTGAVPPGDPARWVRDTVRAEARRGRRTVRRERPYAGTEPAAPLVTGPERAALGAAEGRALRAAMARLPGRCARLLEAMLSPADPTYREIAGELGISQGSLGPIRSRCLGCLRRMLAAEVAVPELRGRGR